MKNLSKGEIIRVSLGLYDHYGIVTEIDYFGQLSVISNSKKHGCVTEESFETFSNGGKVFRVGFPSNLSADQVVEEARRKLGEKYELFSDNCEHFVNWAHNLEPKSEQLRLLGALMFIAFFTILMARS